MYVVASGVANATHAKEGEPVHNQLFDNRLEEGSSGAMGRRGQTPRLPVSLKRHGCQRGV